MPLNRGQALNAVGGRRQFCRRLVVGRHAHADRYERKQGHTLTTQTNPGRATTIRLIRSQSERRGGGAKVRRRSVARGA